VDQGTILKPAARLKKFVPRFARRIYHTMRPQVIIMSGLEKQSNTVLNIAYVGNMPRSYRLGFPGQILRDIDDEVDLGGRWLWQLRKLLKINNCTFSLVESQQYMQGLFRWLFDAPTETCFLPFYVHSIVNNINLPNLLSNNSALKGDVKQAKDAGFTLQISSDPAHYQEFIDVFYRPYVTATHGFLAALFDYSFLCRSDYKEREQWELLQLMDGDKWLAGALVRKGERIVYLTEIGVSNADTGRAKRGAIAALYWLFLQRAQTLGYQHVSFMWSPPFLKNGVLLFKKKYRPTLEAAPVSDQGLLLIPMDRSELSRKILVEQPMIQLEGSQLKATVFVEKTEDMAAARQQLIKGCRRYDGIADYEVTVLEA
jgi:hypothetical protein